MSLHTYQHINFWLIYITARIDIMETTRMMTTPIKWTWIFRTECILRVLWIGADGILCNLVEILDRSVPYVQLPDDATLRRPARVFRTSRWRGLIFIVRRYVRTAATCRVPTISD